MTIAASSFRHPRYAHQDGSFLLEALISFLIVGFGILGIVGLYARSMQSVDDSKFRGEAASLATSLVGQMWVSDPDTASLTANYDSGVAGPGYTEFKTLVAQRLPNSTPPTVTVSAGQPNTNSSNVLITIKWKHPGDVNDPAPREFDFNATIGSNALPP